MAYLNFLDTIGLVSNKESCLESIANHTGCLVGELDLGYINNYHESVSTAKRYFNDNLVETENETPSSKYLWVETGYKKNGEHSIYVSFVRRLGWEGGFVGTELYLKSKLGGYIEAKELSIVPSVSKELAVSEYKPDSKYATEDFRKELYNRLLIKDHWGISPKALTSYLLSLASRVSALYSKFGRRLDCCVVNSEANNIIVNSSLIDKFGNDIYISFKYRNGELVSPSFVESKVSLVKAGFSRDDVCKSLEPVPFYDNIEDTIFNGSFSDFDLGNERRLRHIIVERRERFPEDVQKLSDSVLCNKLVQAIRQGVHISKCDKRYIVPMYCIAMNKVQFMFPFHVSSDISESPELVVLVDKNDGFYDVMTILPLEEAFINQKTLSPYADSWILNPDS